MFGFREKNPSIEVELYENGSLKPFATSSLPITQLPDTFEVDTTLNVQGEEWHVTNARPATKNEFRKTRRVQIYLSKPEIGRMPANDILYSLPTINDSIAELEASPSLENVFVVHEDDWRQQEFISRQYVEGVRAELEAIRQIYEVEKCDIGFKRLHVRSAIPTPLQGVGLTVPELMLRLDLEHEYSGVAFKQYAAIVRGGFAFRSKAGFAVWGQTDENGMLLAVCVQSHDMNSPLNAAMENLVTDHNLLFVDWPRVLVMPPISG